MTSLRHLVVLSFVFFAGYLLGGSVVERGNQPTLQAQSDDPVDIEIDLSEDTKRLVREAYRSLRTARDVLEAEQRDTSPVHALNSFTILSGGVDAIADLESNRGVDPVTFAALYAGRADDDLKPHLKYDEKGRLTYRGNLIRMYAPSRLKLMFAMRDEILLTPDD